MLLWAAGITAEAGLIVAGALANRRTVSTAQRHWQTLDRPTAAMTPGRDSILRDSILDVLSKQHGITLETRGDTLVSARLSPAAESTATQVVGAFQAAATAAAIIVAIIYLPIPLTLVTVTAIWLVGQRHPRSP